MGEIKKRKIIFFTSHLGGGGAEKHLVRLVNNFDYTKYQVFLVVSRGGGSYEHELREEVKFISIFKTYKSSTLALLFSIPKLKKIIREIKPDYVSSFMDRPNLILGFISNNILVEAKLIFNCQVSPFQNYKNGGILGWLTLLLIPKYYKFSDQIISLSHGVAQELKEVMNTDISVAVIPNIALLENRKRVEIIKEKKVYQLVACGRLTKQKGFEYLINAMTGIRYDVNLKIFGIGEDEKKLKNLAIKCNLNNVEFMGFESDPNLIYQDADVFLLTSLWEGFGNVIVEAMSYGVPVISTDCPHGPSEIIENGINGILIKMKDSKQISESINNLISNDALRQMIGENGYKSAHKYSGRIIAQKYMNLLAEL